MAELIYNEQGRLLFTEEMKNEYTILVPQMAPFHFEFLVEALHQEGYKATLLSNFNDQIKQLGVKYVHNDTCYPAILVIGQLLDAIINGDHDPKKIAVIMTQTGGGCRASNYIHLLRSALEKSGYGYIPVVSLSPSKIESNPGFMLPLRFWIKALWSVFYGDILQQLYNEIKPYEINTGSVDRMASDWTERIVQTFKTERIYTFKKVLNNLKELIADFSTIPRNESSLIKVGIVGEIYVKYSSLGNNNLEDFLRSENVEVVIPPLLDFVLFKLDYRGLEVDLYGGKKIKKRLVEFAISIVENYRSKINIQLKKHHFRQATSYKELKGFVKDIIGYGNRMGEGWLLTAEMFELIHIGAPNIICTQPFGCLPNHISGKGVVNAIKKRHPFSNIVPIDYDPGASDVNQKNRIKLMLAIAKDEVHQHSESIVSVKAK
ncbi:MULTISPECIES: 2-hydroxyacyl-CoA dehydratase [unclassified Fusibacter]|uniref:2-hydroxyacyl-CoA dehydratase n=1 Tax=unclassified Fusibacter TaxID=2624464 RepID=UPI0010132FF8|nr:MULTISPECIES: 2-hydroxyacyl-CoA dehydratase [unclassified Fusibacter]NPE22599.1 2-hydroxyglutaryl-CoA dehydratase [Fusibacter sp. A1]RXV60699.1 2-hydroxyglutaryl-CoA dehydratase [Fusibacter sp. A1]